jgi:hypothetical protein
MEKPTFVNVKMLQGISFVHPFTSNELHHLHEWAAQCEYVIKPLNINLLRITHTVKIDYKIIKRDGYIRKVRRFFLDAQNIMREYYLIEYQHVKKTFKTDDKGKYVLDEYGDRIPYYYTYHEDLSHLFGSNNVVSKINKIFNGKLNPLWYILDLEPQESLPKRGD